MKITAILQTPLSKNVINVGLLAVIVTILFTTALQQTTTSAQSIEDSVNDISLRVVFQYDDGEEEVNTFKVYKQLGGYGISNIPKFELAGIIDGGHPLLYREAHAHHHQAGDREIARDFNVAVYLSDGSLTDVHFLYQDCDILDYYIKTGEDVNLKVWNGQAKFPHVEHFVFECNGSHPFHQIDEPMRSEQGTTESTTDRSKKETTTWEDYFK